MVTIVYRKTTSNNMYLNRNLFAPTSWKKGNVKNNRSYLLDLLFPELWKQEIQHLKQIFHEKNDYPKWVINQVAEQVEAKHRTVTNTKQ